MKSAPTPKAACQLLPGGLNGTSGLCCQCSGPRMHRTTNGLSRKTLNSRVDQPTTSMPRTLIQVQTAMTTIGVITCAAGTQASGRNGSVYSATRTTYRAPSKNGPNHDHHPAWNPQKSPNTSLTQR